MQKSDLFEASVIHGKPYAIESDGINTTHFNTNKHAVRTAVSN